VGPVLILKAAEIPWCPNVSGDHQASMAVGRRLGRCQYGNSTFWGKKGIWAWMAEISPVYRFDIRDYGNSRVAARFPLTGRPAGPILKKQNDCSVFYEANA